MPRYRMTVRFNAFKATSNGMEETGSVQNERRLGLCHSMSYCPTD